MTTTVTAKEKKKKRRLLCSFAYKHSVKLIGALLLPLTVLIFTVVITFEQRKDADQQRLQDLGIARFQREQDLNMSILTRENDRTIAEEQRKQALEIAERQKSASRELEEARQGKVKEQYLDELLVAYLNDIGELLEKYNGSLTSNEAMAAFVSAKTLQVLPNLGPIRAGQLIRMLYKARQITNSMRPVLDLTGAHLEDIIMDKSTLSSLRGICLAGAILRNASFVGQDLRESNFSDANLVGANFYQSILDNATFSGSVLVDENTLLAGGCQGRIFDRAVCINGGGGFWNGTIHKDGGNSSSRTPPPYTWPLFAQKGDYFNFSYGDKQEYETFYAIMLGSSQIASPEQCGQHDVVHSQYIDGLFSPVFLFAWKEEVGEKEERLLHCSFHRLRAMITLVATRTVSAYYQLKTNLKEVYRKQEDRQRRNPLCTHLELESVDERYVLLTISGRWRQTVVSECNFSLYTTQGRSFGIRAAGSVGNL